MVIKISYFDPSVITTFIFRSLSNCFESEGTASASDMMYCGPNFGISAKWIQACVADPVQSAAALARQAQATLTYAKAHTYVVMLL